MAMLSLNPQKNKNSQVDVPSHTDLLRTPYVDYYVAILRRLRLVALLLRIELHSSPR